MAQSLRSLRLIFLYSYFFRFTPTNIVAPQALVDIDTVGKEGPDGYGVMQLFKCLLLQFMEDNSDREHERFLQENNTAKWFCGFKLNDKTPDYSLFTRVRKRIGTKRLSDIFSKVRSDLKRQGYMSECFPSYPNE